MLSYPILSCRDPISILSSFVLPILIHTHSPILCPLLSPLSQPHPYIYVRRSCPVSFLSPHRTSPLFTVNPALPSLDPSTYVLYTIVYIHHPVLPSWRFHNQPCYLIRRPTYIPHPLLFHSPLFFILPQSRIDKHFDFSLAQLFVERCFLFLLCENRIVRWL